MTHLDFLLFLLQFSTFFASYCSFASRLDLHENMKEKCIKTLIKIVKTCIKLAKIWDKMSILHTHHEHKALVRYKTLVGHKALLSMPACWALGIGRA